MKQCALLVFFGFAAVMLCAVVCMADEGQVIGRTAVFNLVAPVVLTTADPSLQPGIDMFNFFFGLEVFVGMSAAFFKIVRQVFPGVR